jgi:hypothetical protein
MRLAVSPEDEGDGEIEVGGIGETDLLKIK